MSRFHNYSFGNVLEIARQMPTATRVAGFWTWNNLGRSVNAGAKGIRMLAPIIGARRKKDDQAEKDSTKQNTRAVLGFRNTYVFDISETSGVDLPELHQVSGDPGENIGGLSAFLKTQGIALVYTEKIAPALGCSSADASPSCRASRRRKRFRLSFTRLRTRCCTKPSAAPHHQDSARDGGCRVRGGQGCRLGDGNGIRRLHPPIPRQCLASPESWR